MHTGFYPQRSLGSQYCLEYRDPLRMCLDCVAFTCLLSTAFAWVSILSPETSRSTAHARFCLAWVLILFREILRSNCACARMVQHSLLSIHGVSLGLNSVSTNIEIQLSTRLDVVIFTCFYPQRSLGSRYRLENYRDLIWTRSIKFFLILHTFSESLW